MKYFIHLAYKGTRYHGWQKQKNASTCIQETFEAALGRMTKSKINCIGCGRTDAGVHARQYFCHIIVDKSFDFDPVYRMNKILPEDIKVFEFIPVPEKAHAQKDALERTYDYFIHFQENPFLSEFSTYYPKENIDVKKMQSAVRLLTKYNDFGGMCKQPDIYVNTICKVFRAELMYNAEEERLQFQITADRFLRGMIRIIIGNLLEIGYGKMSVEAFENCLTQKIRPPYFNAAYPQGLYLSQVKYPYFEDRATSFSINSSL